VLRLFVANQPMTQVVDAVRGLLLDQPANPAEIAALAWCAGLVLVFAPLAVWGYGKATAR
jgi:ABC-2 type transport system permease protein